MPEKQSGARIIKVFLASPSDVADERDALASLMSEINDVLAYLAPEKQLSLELVRYETHAYPDLGQPQDVIYREIAQDYDIFIGVMWKHCGTPTKTAPSGTIDEYRRACETRGHGRLPRIMFYFCEEHIPIPGKIELEQLTQVVDFRAEIASHGLWWNYPAHSKFREYVRGGLLRAVRDILQGEGRISSLITQAAAAETVDPEAETQMLGLAADYGQIRQEMPSSDARTARMATVFSKMKANAAAVRSLLEKFKDSAVPGRRLAAIAILQMFPMPDHLDWLAQRLDPDAEKPFVGYQAAVALLEAVRASSVGECEKLCAAIAKAQDLGQRLSIDTDRLKVLKIAENELKTKCDRP
jgi:hypothetical protein